VQVQDDGGQSVTGSAAVTVADAPLNNLQVTAPTATEGVDTGTVTVATFHDTNPDAQASDFTASVDWGDGSSAGSVVALGGANFAVLASHTYLEEGAYTLTVQIDDDGGQSLGGSATVSVADAPLTTLQLTPPSPTEGLSTGTVTVATFHDTNPNADASDFTAS